MFCSMYCQASAWCATCVSKQAEESKSKGARQDVLSKVELSMISLKWTFVMVWVDWD
jgi:hypothetical protein